MDKKYYNLAVFGIQQSRELSINLKKDAIFNLEPGSDVMFYYEIGPNKAINFIIMDKYLRSV